ncbi:hypothetical protein [Candidatus Soleaferrea massiliensis]|uniref:hypothetical protein n=1 Tax=Candidatus Soleaferrea massiliensis TaxID=1470354 RepID=UPI0012E035C2|nr:hypothetical protein [Candidatus Soleaferrea massiliensis]
MVELSRQYRAAETPMRVRLRFLKGVLLSQTDEEQRKQLVRRIDMLRMEIDQLEEISRHLERYADRAEKRRPL